MNKVKDFRYLRLFILIFIITLTVTLFVFRDRIRNLGVYGYPGIFLISMLANASVILPLPGVFITSAMGAVFNPFWVAVWSGVGSAIGELSGYLAGYSGQPVVERARWHEAVEKWMKKYGEITILLMAIIPNPAFDVVGILAGAHKMPVGRFLFWCGMGEIIKMMAFSYGGATILNRLLPPH